MNSGYIKLFRKFKQWEWYNDSKTVHLFIHLLIHANYTDKKWQGIDVKRGQVITGRKQLSADTGISEQSIRTCLERLKATNELTSISTSKYSIITICNYDRYQCQENEINQQTNQQSTSNQPQLRKNKKDKEEKNIYGEFKNILLTEKEYKKLQDRFNGECESKIEKISNYVASTGKKYKSHYATIINWASKDTPKQKDSVWI